MDMALVLEMLGKHAMIALAGFLVGFCWCAGPLTALVRTPFLSTIFGVMVGKIDSIIASFIADWIPRILRPFWTLVLFMSAFHYLFLVPDHENFVDAVINAGLNNIGES
jgi:hypothetical protein